MYPPVSRPRAAAPLLLASLLLLFVLSASSCSPKAFEIVAPANGLLTADGPVALKLRLRADVDPASLVLLIDGQPAQTTPLVVQNDEVTAELLGLVPGLHQLEVQAGGASGGASFETVLLDRPDECDILNQAECALPYPSSHFLEPASTETGFRVRYGPTTLPPFIRLQPPFSTGPADPAPYLQNDGFSPGAHALMHFPGGVDWEASAAATIRQATRTYDDRGLDADSPTVLVDFETGERVVHWVENDDRADPTAGQNVASFLRPGVALLEGHRYIVAVRNIVDAQGAAVEAEPVFAAIRDRRPTDIPQVDARGQQLEPVLARLEQLGVVREELVLAFDFTVMSTHSLTWEMLSMRDQALAWVDQQIDADVQTFTVTVEDEVNPSCADPTNPVWKIIEGTFQVPLFLDRDNFGVVPDANGNPIGEWPQLSFLLRDPDGDPTWNDLSDAPFGLAIPCSVFNDPAGPRALPGMLLGHGLFGDGIGMVRGVTQSSGLGGFDYIAVGTNWSGLSRLEVVDALGNGGGASLLQSFVVKVISDPDTFEALPDRLRQGQVASLVLTRLLATGALQMDPAIRGPNGELPIDPSGDPVYFGVSLGGIMGTFHAALSQDIGKFNVDVPAVNFTLLLQRATPFIPFQTFVELLNPDPLQQVLGIHLQGDLWARGEPVGYVNHVTGNRLSPLPDTPAKQMLVTAALHDQQVANLASQALGSSLGVGVHEGSAMKGLAGMPDTTGPQDSAYIVYDTAAFDLSDPVQQASGIIPPLVNRPAVSNRCDPHNRRQVIPASVSQLLTFLPPGGKIENFCSDDGVCNASDVNELPSFDPGQCDPFPPPAP